MSPVPNKHIPTGKISAPPLTTTKAARDRRPPLLSLPATQQGQVSAMKTLLQSSLPTWSTLRAHCSAPSTKLNPNKTSTSSCTPRPPKALLFVSSGPLSRPWDLQSPAGSWAQTSPQALLSSSGELPGFWLSADQKCAFLPMRKF